MNPPPRKQTSAGVRPPAPVISVTASAMKLRLHQDTPPRFFGKDEPSHAARMWRWLRLLAERYIRQGIAPDSARRVLALVRQREAQRG